MKHLLIVSLAIGIFSSAPVALHAQTSVNVLLLNEGAEQNNSSKFIEGVDMKSEGAAFVSFKKEATPAIEQLRSLQFKYAQLMNTEVEGLKNFSLYEFIDQWWNTRYRFGGCTKKGVDCSSYTGALLSTVFNIVAPRTAKAQYAECTKINEGEELKEGDLVFFNTRGGVSHVGIYIGNGYFTHASVHSGVTISNLNESYYAKRYIGAGRLICE